ncbi:RdgB/HAM1 family non-canonical purine NTP pyrophosphatase [bacterium]|jgi:XTP/dITP diphosphohydrolase|nr:RdgB/HAM1 family non-canonical purine NTP pyrophosphatase [bacterium]MBT4634129.1 RdgB/HAM1 family non-canonical purine NTP pyrophosphatase [bacterium]
MKILIGSNNKGKIEEYRALLGSNFDPLPLSELGINLDVEEAGSTYEENALIKLNFLKGKCNFPILTDDSGIEVECLHGRPGIYSARYAGDNATDDANIDKLLDELDGTSSRRAKFVCSIAYFDPTNNSEIIMCNGECEGEILQDRRGVSGFGYDPIFYLPILQRSFAELAKEEKNTLSHRYKAVRELLKRINI